MEDLEDLITTGKAIGHCKFQTATTNLSKFDKIKIYNYEKNKDTMSINSFKRNFNEIYTENKELWNPSDDQEQKDPYRLIIGMIKTKSKIGIQYVVGGIRCCDTIFQIYQIENNEIISDRRILLD